MTYYFHRVQETIKHNSIKSSYTMATVIPGEASETDDDGDSGGGDGNDLNEISMKHANSIIEKNSEIRNRDLNDVQQQLSWSVHVDEKLENRWRSLGHNTIKLAERQAFPQRKQFGNLKQNLSNTQRALQAISSTFRQAAENLRRVEWNLSLLQEGAKLIPNFSSVL
ncbi:unnamed protein product [Litomosoides sigmodontis]|uniref:Uncharacterized protein n=1 Tax=Litomosoides sigmodontis TaxID=42156 RepID=A0A3P6TZB1_LITSI|nr:unnamed protein product [Litomosoides sigmodontis]